MESSDRYSYCEAVGTLAYLMVGTCRDIAYVVGVATRRLDHA